MLADHCGALPSAGLEYPEVIAAFALAAKFCGLLLALVCWLIIAVPLQAAGLSSPEVLAAVAIAVRFALAAEMASATACASAPIVAALFPSVAALPLQSACLSSRAVDLGCWFSALQSVSRISQVGCH